MDDVVEAIDEHCLFNEYKQVKSYKSDIGGKGIASDSRNENEG